jgi:hypothetical protein
MLTGLLVVVGNQSEMEQSRSFYRSFNLSIHLPSVKPLPAVEEILLAVDNVLRYQYPIDKDPGS